VLSSTRAALSLVCEWERLGLVDVLNNRSCLGPGSHQQLAQGWGGRREVGGWWGALAVRRGHSVAACSQLTLGTGARAGLEAEGGFGWPLTR